MDFSMESADCVAGDVAVVSSARSGAEHARGSTTFLKWHGEVISATNQCGLRIPEGFAHGFQTLTENCELLYLHTAAYEPASEGGVNPLDPRVAIRWPLDITHMSDRDRRHAL